MLEKVVTKDKLVCNVFTTRDEMGKIAARDIAACMRKLLSEKDHINMIFAAAPSQNDVLKHLVKEENIDWSRVNAFHMDEYVGLSGRYEKSFACYLDEHIFKLVPFKSVNYLGYEQDENTVSRYENLLKENPIDITILGIGENGHIAFNDPGEADFNDKHLVKKVKLDDICRMQQVNDKTFDTFDEVPQYALSLTIPMLISSTYMFCQVPTANKAWAVRETLSADINEQVPATAMRNHEHATMYVDIQAGKYIL